MAEHLGKYHILTKKIELTEMVLNRFRREPVQAQIKDGLMLDPDHERLLELKETDQNDVDDRVFGGLKSLFQ